MKDKVSIAELRHFKLLCETKPQLKEHCDPIKIYDVSVVSYNAPNLKWTQAETKQMYGTSALRQMDTCST